MELYFYDLQSDTQQTSLWNTNLLENNVREAPIEAKKFDSGEVYDIFDQFHSDTHVHNLPRDAIRHSVS